MSGQPDTAMAFREMAPLYEATNRTRVLRRGFTLVEVMVVIAIIAVLISILLPSLKAVRTRVHESRTQVAISGLETGIHQYLADTRCGGSLPPSAAPGTTLTGYDGGQILSPHTGSILMIDGASLLFWALAGADLIGTPGFQDLNGNGTWADDTGATTPQQLYRLSGTKPNYPRSGPYVDLSKMKLPPMTAPDKFTIPAAKGAIRTLPSLCFLDSFDQPILYYKANLNKPLMVGEDIGAGNKGIYNKTDNTTITTGDGTCSMSGVCNYGMNFGAGLIAAGQYHFAAKAGEGADLGKSTAEVLTALQNPANRCFSRTVWNPNVAVVPRPHNDKSYILLSAGADGVFGSADDIANFEVNK